MAVPPINGLLVVEARAVRPLGTPALLVPMVLMDTAEPVGAGAEVCVFPAPAAPVGGPPTMEFLIGGGAAQAASGTTGGTGGTGGRGEVRVWTIKGTNADLAEIYTSNDLTLEAGDVVAIDPDLRAGVKKTISAYEAGAVGIISTKPAQIIGDAINEGNNVVPVALAGRVPVKVSLENGPISAGDYLTTSSIPGVAMKATKAGLTIGTAIGSFDGTGGQTDKSIMVFVNTSYTTGMLLHKVLTAGGYDIPEEVWRSKDIDYSWYVLAGMASEGKKLTSGQIAEIYGDRVAATLEVIAPRIIAETIYTSEIKATESGNLVINALNTFIDNVLNTVNIIAENIKAGTVEAQKLAAGMIETGLISPIPGEDLAIELPQDSRFKIQDSAQNEVASIDNQGNATFSGELTAREIHSENLDEIEALLAQVQTDQAVLFAATASAGFNASQSANLSELITSDLFVTSHAAISSLLVNETLTAENLNSLSEPLKIQSLAAMPVEIMAGLIKIDTQGNVQIAGNLDVAGKITAPKADFKELSVENLIVASSTSGEPELTPEESSSEVTSGDITTNSTVGKALIPAGVDQITITNPKVTDYTLVYVTPTSSTQNRVLYVKEKSIGYFVVGFTDPIDIDTNFNWWIVQVE
ncbi:MAG: hypothetical protein UU32_C0004G0019 [Candidatus Woesebacteria bacterium GW2011_GWB1_41_10]|uniref:Uncharacterized protein n=1 Tax=Candidatus Woesebacteria bacterium GW2011_GWB1_41_10 TaxID=1618577 RepID=A0A0G0UFJ1_9BACT|nr:MAG: hypothetical protein UU32_C0004G0019 [Candidatus Woesebacteria bacterium GW2011_GWB1_41_10]